MKFLKSSHGPAEKRIPLKLVREVEQAIKSVKITCRNGAAPAIRKAIDKSLREQGWPHRMSLAVHSEISITSAKQRIGLCVQLGNIARMYADLLKLQTLFLKKSLTAAIFVLPTLDCAKSLGSNLANSSRLLKEMTIYRPVITIPLLIISIR